MTSSKAPQVKFQDFLTVGTDRQGIYVGFNDFSIGSFTQFVLLLPKAPIYAGSGFSYYFFFNFTFGGAQLDSIQPANVQGPGDNPRAEFLIHSFNINFGGGNCQTGCNGLIVWAISNPLVAAGSPGPEISAVVVPTANNYFLPPNANLPGLPTSIETLDTRITGEVTYTGGSLYAALGTAALTGPGATVIRYKINPVLNDGNNARCTGAFTNACADITAAAMAEEECYFCGGRGFVGSNYFGTIVVDAEGNSNLVYNYSDNNAYPGTAYTSKRVTAHTLHDVGFYLEPGFGAYRQFVWGYRTAVAGDYSDPMTPAMWFSGMYSQLTGLWGTVIGRNAFTSPTQP